MFPMKLKTEFSECDMECQKDNEIRSREIPALREDKRNWQYIQQQSRTIERDLTERSREQIIVDLVTRLKENGYTQNTWEHLNKTERADSLQKATVLMSQEMLFPPEFQEKLQIHYIDQLRPEEGDRFLTLENRLLEIDDASQVYANIYHVLQQKLEFGMKNFPYANTETYMSAKETYSRLEMDMFGAAYRENNDISGGLSASQGLEIMARADFNEAARLRRSASSMPQAEASIVLSRANSLEQSGKRLMREYNNAVKKAQKKS